MNFHYDLLQLVFDGWIVLLMVGLFVIAAVRLTGRRRAFVAGGFGLCALATVLWLPMVSGVLLAPLAAVLGPDLVWHVPTLPWLAGIILVAAGTFRAPQRPVAASALASGSDPAYPAPTGPAYPAPAPAPTAEPRTGQPPSAATGMPDFVPHPGVEREPRP